MTITHAFATLVATALLAQAGAAQDLAPTTATVQLKLPGRTINGTLFTSTTRFNYEGELGNWSYQKISANVGRLTQTYDSEGNNPATYREEVTLTFTTATTGNLHYAEYVGNALDLQESASFDFPWIAVNTYTVTASAGSGGSIDPAGGIAVDEGTNRTFTADPDDGFATGAWSLDSLQVQSGGTSYTVTNVQQNHTLTVSFVSTGGGGGDDSPEGPEIEDPADDAPSPDSSNSNSLDDSAGKYTGLLTSDLDDSVVGYIKTFKVASSGKFSAKLHYDGDWFSVKGVFDGSGAFNLTTSEDGTSVVFALQLTRTTGGGQKVEGTITVDGFVIDVEAIAPGPTISQAGVYTLLIPSDADAPSEPQGHGFGLMTVTSTGAAKIKGMLGDGSKWTAKCHVTPDGEMPVFAPLYKKVGALAGLITFRDVAGVSDCDGTVQWTKPAGTGIAPYAAGFDLERTLIGCTFQDTGDHLITSIADTTPNVTAHVGANSEDAAEAVDLVWSAANTLTYEGELELKVKVKAKNSNGDFKGGVADPTGKVKVLGVVFQKQSMAAGFVYEKGAEPRSLTVSPTP